MAPGLLRHYIGSTADTPGDRYTAKQIYYFYRTLRIVAVKLHRVPPSDGHTTEPPPTGMRRLRSAKIKAALIPQRKRIVEEYFRATGRVGDAPVSESAERKNFDQAVRYLCATILQDMRPPWLTSYFGGPFYLDGLSLYTRPKQSRRPSNEWLTASR